MRVRRIAWPAASADPLMIAEADGSWHWDVKFPHEDDTPDDTMSLGPHPFWQWHRALTDAMHWGYNPETAPPVGWVRLD